MVQPTSSLQNQLLVFGVFPTNIIQNLFPFVPRGTFFAPAILHLEFSHTLGAKKLRDWYHPPAGSINLKTFGCTFSFLPYYYFLCSTFLCAFLRLSSKGNLISKVRSWGTSNRCWLTGQIVFYAMPPHRFTSNFRFLLFHVKLFLQKMKFLSLKAAEISAKIPKYLFRVMKPNVPL